MFLDKDHILSRLNRLYSQETFVSASLYSSPGCGKTRLLREFARDKKILYFKASHLLEEENFRLMKDLCVRELNASFSSAKKFPDLFRLLGKEARKTPLVFILDDFPHLVLENKRFSTYISSAVRREWKTSKLFVLFCKPASLYEKESPKDSYSFLMRPFTFFETRKLFPGRSLEEQLLLYAVTGGLPGYLKYFSEELPVKESLVRLFFREDGILYRLPSSRIQEYYAKSSVIRTILLSLGNSCKKLQEICDRSGLTPSAAGSLLTSLSNTGLVEKIIPVTEEKGSRRTLYKIKDCVFRFWYAFVLPYLGEIETGRGEEVFQKYVFPRLNLYLQDFFEDICREFLALEQARGETPFHLENIGMWWGQHPTKKRTEYIPVAASHENQILLGTCFWTEDWIDADALNSLKKHAGLFPHMEQWFYLFSKSGFVTGFEAISGNRVKAYSLEEMCRIAGDME